MTADASGAADKIRELMIVERSANTNLTPSLKAENGFSPLVHDAKGVQEQVVLFAPDGTETEVSGSSPGNGGTSAQDIITRLVVAGAIVGATVFVDRVIAPKVSRYLATRKARNAALREAAEETKGTVDKQQPSSEVVETGAEITAQQWYQLFFEAVAHGAAGRAHHSVSSEAWQALASTRVTDDDETQALAAAMRELTPEQIEERVTRVLEQHPELLEEEPEVVLRRLFGADASEQPRHIGLEEPGADEGSREQAQ